MEMRGLGYIGIATRDVAGWRSLMVDVLGVGESAGPPGANGDTLYLKMDDRTWRIAIHPGEDEDVRVRGLGATRRGGVRPRSRALQRSGVKVRPGTDALRAARGVQDVAQFDDPFGNHHELFYGAMIDEFVFVPPSGGTRVSSPTVSASATRSMSCLRATTRSTSSVGSWASGSPTSSRGGPTAPYSCARRRAITVSRYIDLPIPGGPGLNHFMIEAKTLEDVGRAYDRAMDARVNIVNSLGQHSNDPMLSFYVQTPSGFNVELGWKGLMVDDSNWTVRTYTGRGEMWGHRGVYMDDIADAKVG